LGRASASRHAQQDPLVAYKRESFEMFEGMMMRFREATARRLFRMQILGPDGTPIESRSTRRGPGPGRGNSGSAGTPRAVPPTLAIALLVQNTNAPRISPRPYPTARLRRPLMRSSVNSRRRSSANSDKPVPSAPLQLPPTATPSRHRHR
jgi:hypothetical protein